MGKHIITIGREHGSGGLYIGEELGKALGITCYDSQLVMETAANSGLAPSYIAANEEQRPTSLLYTLVMGITSSQGDSLPVQLYRAESEAIRRIANRESCIFIGRCSDYILRDNPDVINVFVHAPLAERIRRVCEYDHLTPVAAARLIQTKDRERSTYYDHFTGQKWGYAKNYHLSLDTSVLGTDGAIEAILQYIALVDKRKNAQ